MKKQAQFVLPQENEADSRLHGVICAANTSNLDSGSRRSNLEMFVNGMLTPPSQREARVKHLVNAAANSARAAAAAAGKPANEIEAAYQGALAAANDNTSQFGASFFIEPITTFATGWQDPYMTLEMLNRIAPMIPTGRKWEYQAQSNDQAFLSESDDLRALDEEFKTVKYDGKMVLGSTVDKGLTIVLDRRRLESYGPLYLERFTARLTQRLLRNEMIRAVSGLLTAVTASKVVWNAGGDPDADLLKMVKASRDDAGFSGNVILMDDAAGLQRDLSLRSAALTPGALVSSQLSTGFSVSGASGTLAPNNGNTLARYLRVDDVIELPSRITTGVGTKAGILSNQVILYFAMAGQMIDDPSNIKRMVSPFGLGGDAGVNGGGAGQFAVFVDDTKGKMTIRITVAHCSSIAIPTTKGIQVRTVALK